MTFVSAQVVRFLSLALALGLAAPSILGRPEADSIRLRRRQAELELRRAGGPRPAVVEQLLEEGAGDPDWLYSVVDFCKRGLIDCRKYHGVAEKNAQREGRSSDASTMRLLAELDREALIQSRAVSERRALYRLALQRGVARAGDLEVHAGEAAQRALRENLFELLPSAMQGMGHWPRTAQMAAAPFVEIAKAMKGAGPTEALTLLVRSAAADEVASLRTPLERRWSADSRAELSRGIARLALDKLRELNPPGAAEELKRVVALYQPVGEAFGNEKASREVRGAVKPSYLGRLGIYIVQAIGDLGDREFEGLALGYRTLWDEVREAEEQLSSRGRLKSQARVAQ